MAVPVIMGEKSENEKSAGLLPLRESSKKQAEQFRLPLHI